MFAMHVPTWMCAVALPMSCAVARASLFTSVVKMASKPASSATLAASRMSLARQPAPGMTVTPSRSTLIPVPLFFRARAERHGARPARLPANDRLAQSCELLRHGTILAVVRQPGRRLWSLGGALVEPQWRATCGLLLNPGAERSPTVTRGYLAPQVRPCDRPGRHRFPS